MATREHTGRWRYLAVTALAGFGFYGFLLMLLPRPQLGVFGGDQGVKYLQIESIAEGHPWLSNKAEEIDPERNFYPLRAPFAFTEGGRIYSVYLNPITYLAAPAFRVAGVEGCTWLTVMSAVGIALAAAALGHSVTRRSLDSVALGIFVLVGTPVWFYGAVFWEHAPAVFPGLVATAILCRERITTFSVTLAGALTGFAAASRPEAAMYLAAVVLAWAIATRNLRKPAWLLLVAILVWLALNTALRGASFTEHLRLNYISVDVFLESRRSYAERLLGGFLASSGGTNLQMMIPGLAASAGVLVFVGLIAGRAVWVAACSLGVVVVIASAVPALLSARDGSTQLTGLLSSCPLVALGLLFSGAVARRGFSRAARPAEQRASFLSLTVLLFLSAAIALTPNDGGNQWGARYLLYAYPLLSLIVLAFFRSSFVPASATLRTLAGAVLVVAVATSLTVQAVGVRNYIDMIQNKTSALARITELPGRYVLTPLWFVPQEAALLSVANDKIFLLVQSPSQLGSAISKLAQAGQESFAFVESSRTPHGSRRWRSYAEGAGFSFYMHPFELRVTPFRTDTTG